MLDDLAKTVKAQLYERVSSPLLGAFAISWIAWNYRFLLVLFSSMPAAEKLTYIDTNIFDSYQIIFLNGTLYPLLTALSLIFIYPIPAKFVYEYWRKRQCELKEVQQRIDDETPLTQEEARELRHEALRAKLDFEQELKRSSDEIERLKEIIRKLEPQEKPSPNTSPIRKSKSSSIERIGAIDELSEEQLEMLQKIGASGKGSYQESIVQSSGPNRIVNEYNLGELRAKELVSKDFDRNRQDFLISITHSGRTYLVKHMQRTESTTKP